MSLLIFLQFDPEKVVDETGAGDTYLQHLLLNI
jgi:sugar/nucleoside kinase (ribokinase family)